MKIYPKLTVENNKNPNKFYAVPLLGLLIKVLILILVFFEGIFLGITFLFFWIANSFVILFTGQYWDAAYQFFLGIMRFGTKISVFLFGLTDKYPGFDLSSNGLFDLEIEKPAHP